MSCKRMHLPGDIHLVTNRCFQGRLLMLPNKKINFIIGYWFARALKKYGQGLKIYAFVFLSNHLHILLRDTQGSLAAFMCYFESNVARAVNEARGRKGAFWENHYDDKIIDGEGEFLKKYTYVTCNAVKAGLVNRAEEWIGWCSTEHALNGKPYCFTAINRNQYNKASRNRKKKPDPKLYEETYTFCLEPLLGLENMSIEEQADYLRPLIAAQEADFRELRGNKPPLGIDAIQRQNPFDRPCTSAKKPKRRFACESKEKLNERMESLRQFIGLYATVHQQFKTNLKSSAPFHNEWPIGSYPPSRWRPCSAVGG
jgi:REP element-mobilizing transposase RayT